MTLNVLVFYGSNRSERQGIKAAKFIINKLKERNHNVFFADSKEFDFGLLDKMYKEFENGTAPKKMQELAKEIKKSDVFVVVSGEYNHSMPPALSNLMDHFLEEYGFRPSAIVSYSAGMFGGVRAAMHLRAFLAELGISSIPSIFPVPRVSESIDSEGNALNKDLEKYVKRFLDEMEWYAYALKEYREKNGVPY